MVITKRQLLSKIDTRRIEAAIAEAERHTTGEVVVSVAPFFIGRADKLARRAFERLGVAKTKDRNGVLFFLVPSRHRLVLLGDEGIHTKVGQEFWEETAAKLAAYFRRGDFTGGLIEGIAEVACVLANHFPADATAPAHDELSNEIDFYA
jgi:uncharacterized membrane protein